MNKGGPYISFFSLPVLCPFPSSSPEHWSPSSLLIIFFTSCPSFSSITIITITSFSLQVDSAPSSPALSIISASPFLLLIATSTAQPSLSLLLLWSGSSSAAPPSFVPLSSYSSCIDPCCCALTHFTDHHHHHRHFPFSAWSPATTSSSFPWIDNSNLIISCASSPILFTIFGDHQLHRSPSLLIFLLSLAVSWGLASHQEALLFQALQSLLLSWCDFPCAVSHVLCTGVFLVELRWLQALQLLHSPPVSFSVAVSSPHPSFRRLPDEHRWLPASNHHL